MNGFVSVFDKVQKDLPGRDVSWLREARGAAIARFAEMGLPTTEDEAWRFTKLDAIADAAFAPGSGRLAAGARSGSILAGRGNALRLVFVDGHFLPDLSDVSGLPRGVVAASLSAALKADPEAVRPFLSRRCASAFELLNSALFSDGAFIKIADGVLLERPIHLHFLASAPSTPSMAQARAIVSLGRGASASLIEESSAAGEGTYFANFVTEIALAEDASLKHYKVQREGAGSSHIASLAVRQGRNSRLAAHSFSFGAALARNDVSVELAEEGAECSLSGLYLAQGRQHVDNHTFIDHAAPHGTSRELYKGVLDGSARAVFNGAISVRPAAQKTDAQVYNKNLLLSEQGLVNTKPEFKINANDVQCKHGATIGQLSQDALFYLRSRGLGAEEARRLLVYAFASEMVDRVELPALKESLGEFLSTKLPGEP